MGKEVKRNQGLRIINLVLVILLPVVIVTLFYTVNELNKYKDEYSASQKGRNEKETKLSKLNAEINEEKAKDDLDLIDEKIIEKKKEYFQSIKELEDKILSGKSDKKIAYLTFDDGPYYNTYKFLDILDKYDVKATFFTTSINGEKCYDNRNENCLLLYQEYLKREHTIANHTYTHGLRSGLYSSTENFITAVKNQENHIKTQTGYITNIVRFPGGSVTAGSLKGQMIEELRENNYGWVDWTAQDGDGGGLTSKEQAWTLFTSSINENIEVILFHDYNNITLSILPDAIEYLQEKGYILLPLFYESNMVNK